MKQKITLFAFMFLVTLFAFGQKTELKNNELFWKSKAEEQLNEMKQDDNKVRQYYQFQRNKNFPQNSSLKSSQAIKQKLDSLVSQYWNEINNQWIASAKRVFTYDTNANLTQSYFYNWDETTTQWVGYFKMEYAYDANGNMIQSFFCVWDQSTSEWVVQGKKENIYDVNGNMTQCLSYYWDESINQWIASEKGEYTYDVNGNMTQFIFYVWDENGSLWIPYIKNEYTYDANGNMTLFFSSHWDETANQWIVNDKEEYTYNANGNNTQYIYYVWHETTNQWVPSIKEEYTYNANGNMIQEIKYNWDETTNQWVGLYKYEYTFDTNGNITESITYQMDGTASQWFAITKYEFTYNNSYSFSDLILPYLYTEGGGSIYYNHMLTEVANYYWDETSSGWVIWSKDTHYYSEQNINSVPEINGVELNVYPNPFSTSVSFNISDYHDIIILKIFDIQGRRVISKEIRNHEKVNMEGLNDGMYFYNLSFNGKRLNGKLIKE